MQSVSEIEYQRTTAHVSRTEKAENLKQCLLRREMPRESKLGRQMGIRTSGETH
jgi:hypothetical protein